MLFRSRFAKANVKNKKKFGEDARLAFKRHLDDLKRSKKNDNTFPYVFDEEKAKDIAMHVAAINPKYISQDEIPQVEKDREDAVQTEIMANDPKLANKPEKVLEGIKRGKLNKVFSEWCLLDQEFIKTPKESVAKYLGKAKVLEMARFQVGEGIEKKEENFAEEVAAQMKQ